MKKIVFFAIIAAILNFNLVAAAQSANKYFGTIVFTASTDSDQQFEQLAHDAKAAGATHVLITDNIPPAMWQFDTPNDPYPAWMLYKAGFFKICPPPAIKPYIPADYTKAVLDTLKGRCQILKKYGLKAMFTTNEPQVLPESVFTEHPLWRGPRVDQANRSRVARFAPNVDDPEVLQLYRQSIKELLTQCPEIDYIDFVTTDCGAGLDYSPGLYPGINGNTLYKNRTLEERFLGFVNALQKGGEDAGKHIQIHVRPIEARNWMIPSFPDVPEIVKQLPKGMALDNHEGPDGTIFKASAGINSEWNCFYPVIGIPQPVTFLTQLMNAYKSKAPRLVITLDKHWHDLYIDIYNRYWQNPFTDEISKLQLLKAVAASQAGTENAENILNLYLEIDNCAKYISILDIGDIFCVGSVHQRWITRPFVPFPQELTQNETSYWRNYIFQARSEKDAMNMIDLQATTVYGGWSGRYFVDNILTRAQNNLKKAQGLLDKSLTNIPKNNKDSFNLLIYKLKLLNCLINNANNTCSYQAQIDRVRQLGIKPDDEPVLGTQSSWDRTLIMETARSEIDNCAVMIKILKEAPENIIETSTPEIGPTIRSLEPNITESLKKKIDIMNAHWEDYKRVFTTPNP